MKKTLYLHIGGHKTGTSAIQYFLCLNRNNLLNNGYLYPYTGKSNAHHFFPHGIQNKTSLYANPKEKITIVMNEIKSTCQCNIIISSEDFELLNKEEISALKNLISRKFFVKIIFYARRQDSSIESRYNQRVKAPKIRLKKTFYGFFRDDPFPRLDYYSLLSNWKEIFGKENIIVRCYEKEQLSNGLFFDFLSAIGLELDDNYIIPKEKINQSLPWDLIEIIRLCNIQFKNIL